MYELIFYETARGDVPAIAFLRSQPRRAQSKVEKWLLYLREQGPDLPRPYADVVRGKIRELRIRYPSLQLRFLYFFDGHSAVIVSGFLKKTSAVPEEEIDRAECRMLDWLSE